MYGNATVSIKVQQKHPVLVLIPHTILGLYMEKHFPLYSTSAQA